MPDVDIIVPVHNEQHGLERSIRRLHRFLRESFPFTWRIVIADNASTDGTPVIGAALANELAVLVAATLTATVTRYVALRTWVFARRSRQRSERVASPACSTTSRSA